MDNLKQSFEDKINWAEIYISLINSDFDYFDEYGKGIIMEDSDNRTATELIDELTEHLKKVDEITDVIVDMIKRYHKEIEGGKYYVKNKF